jgi:ribonuclease HI
VQLINLDVLLHIRWKWLRGYNGHPLQYRADALAYAAARSLASTQRLAA